VVLLEAVQGKKTLCSSMFDTVRSLDSASKSCAAQKLSEALQSATLGIVVTESGSSSPSIFVMQTAED